jgi:hypothetical protein
MAEDSQRAFSITNLLTKNEQSEDVADKEAEDNSSTRTSSSASQLSPDEEPNGLAGMLGFNPLLMQQMAQSAAAAFALQSKANVTPIAQATLPKHNPQPQEAPTTSANLRPNANPEWYNAMNYLNIASRQFQLMSGNQAGNIFYSI